MWCLVLNHGFKFTSAMSLSIMKPQMITSVVAFRKTLKLEKINHYMDNSFVKHWTLNFQCTEMAFYQQSYEGNRRIRIYLSRSSDSY